MLRGELPTPADTPENLSQETVVFAKDGSDDLEVLSRELSKLPNSSGVIV
jgi:hypothetical protein